MAAAERGDRLDAGGAALVFPVAGGLLVVEAVLVPGLVSSGMTLPAAISAMMASRSSGAVFTIRAPGGQ